MKTLTDVKTGAEDPFRPGYLRLLETGELDDRVRQLESLLGACRICPRACGADRLAGRLGPCFGGRQAIVNSACDHHGEEPPIAGTRGSGTIFFANCNLRCVYCQNHQISQAMQRDRRDGIGTDDLAAMMLGLQARGCHNINFVSPTHYAPQLAAAVAVAARRGLRLPIVYNTNGYDAVETLRLMEGIVDIYLPDLKYGDDETGREYSRVRGYASHARAAITEMWRQTGRLQVGPDGLARRGVLLRHLILPNGLADSEESLKWLRTTCGPELTISLMAQYYPAHKASRFPLLARRITPREYERVLACAERLGFEELLVQDPQDAPETYQPDFTRDHPFHWEK